MSSVNIAWAPHPGNQVLALTCPFWELLVEGNRGGGKTLVLLADFAQHCGPKRHELHQAGYGAAWRGILFRRTYPDLSDVIAKSKWLFGRIFPEATYNESAHTWRWPTGEELLLRHAARLPDVDGYQGHEYPWIGFEELGTWAKGDVYDLMKACSRSSMPGMPRKVRATCNPAGVGHNWLKRRFIDPATRGTPIKDKFGNIRVCLHLDLKENATLLRAEPDYPAKIAAAAGANPHKLKAWLHGDWDIVAGGMFDDLWEEKRNVIEPFVIPESWSIHRSLDWGSAKPFSVGWWARSDGTGHAPDYITRGSIVRIGEWYGCDPERENTGIKMTATDVGHGIVAREQAMMIRDRVLPGPADSSIWVAEPGNVTIAEDLENAGAEFIPADKKSGSRRSGWEKLRQLIQAGAQHRKEAAALYVFNTCRDFIRTVPVLPRSDSDPDDVDTDAEDHIGDETRYYATAPERVLRTRRFAV